MEVKLNKATPEQLKTPPASMSGVVFGTQFSDHMFSMEWEDGKGWHNAEIKPYGPGTRRFVLGRHKEIPKALEKLPNGKFRRGLGVQEYLSSKPLPALEFEAVLDKLLNK